MGFDLGNFISDAAKAAGDAVNTVEKIPGASDAIKFVAGRNGVDPNVVNAITDVGTKIANSNPVIAAAGNLGKDVPGFQRGFALGVGTMQTPIDRPQHLAILRGSLPPNDQHGFDTAVALHVGRIRRPAPPLPPKARAGYQITHGMVGAPTAQKELMMGLVAADPDARGGAVRAVKEVADGRESLWEKLMSALGFRSHPPDEHFGHFGQDDGDDAADDDDDDGSGDDDSGGGGGGGGDGGDSQPPKKHKRHHHGGHHHAGAHGHASSHRSGHHHGEMRGEASGEPSGYGWEPFARPFLPRHEVEHPGMISPPRPGGGLDRLHRDGHKHHPHAPAPPITRPAPPIMRPAPPIMQSPAPPSGFGGGGSGHHHHHHKAKMGVELPSTARFFGSEAYRIGCHMAGELQTDPQGHVSLYGAQHDPRDFDLTADPLIEINSSVAIWPDLEESLDDDADNQLLRVATQGEAPF
jgi:hypothetical protein